MLTRSVRSFSAKGEFVLKSYPSGDFSVGRAQPIKRDKGIDPLGGIYRDELGWTNLGREPDVVPSAEKLFKLAEKFDKSDRADLAYQFGIAAGRVASQNSDRQFWIDPTAGLSPDLWGADYLAHKREESFNEFRASQDAADDPSLMGLSVASISRKRTAKLKRGSNGLTGKNKRLTKSGIALLERYFKHKCCTFGTATLPTLTNEQLKSVCDGWGKIVNRFFEGLTRLLERRGLSKHYVYVAEIQEERWVEYGQLCPHLHFIVQGKTRQGEFWRILPEEVKAIWQRVLENHLGCELNCDAATRIEQPRKSLIAEMGKYLTKGGKLFKEIKLAQQTEMLPSAYCGMSRALKKEVNSEIVTLSGDLALSFIDQLDWLKKAGHLEFRSINLDYGGREICVGWVGYLKSISLEEILIDTQTPEEIYG